MKGAKTIKLTCITPTHERSGCAVCTTPSRCKTPALGIKGSACAGRANGPDDCDCLNACGDDPWLKDGRSLPCERRAKEASQ